MPPLAGDADDRQDHDEEGAGVVLEDVTDDRVLGRLAERGDQNRDHQRDADRDAGERVEGAGGSELDQLRAQEPAHASSLPVSSKKTSSSEGPTPTSSERATRCSFAASPIASGETPRTRRAPESSASYSNSAAVSARPSASRSGARTRVRPPSARPSTCCRGPLARSLPREITTTSSTL